MIFVLILTVAVRWFILLGLIYVILKMVEKCFIAD